jgi:hypothetical protein
MTGIKRNSNSIITWGIGGLFVLALVNSCTDTASNKSTASSSKSSPYNSPAFKNADPKVQEDVIIYNTLRTMGYSEQESKDAVIKSMNK